MRADGFTVDIAADGPEALHRFAIRRPDLVLLDSRTLDTHVRRLRMKLEPDVANPRYLRTVRGVGFRFDVDPGY